MPSKAGVWENADFLRELSLALFQVASNGGALSVQAKTAVESYLKLQGHEQSWESVRYDYAVPYFLSATQKQNTRATLSFCYQSFSCNSPLVCMQRLRFSACVLIRR